MSAGSVLRYALIPRVLAEGEAFSAWLFTTDTRAVAEAATDRHWRAVALLPAELPADHGAGAVLFVCIADVEETPDDHSADASAHTTQAAARRATADANGECAAVGCPPCWTTLAIHLLPGTVAW